MYELEVQRLLGHLGLLVHALVLPYGGVYEVLVVAFRLTLFCLVLDAEVSAARLLAVEGVACHELAQFEEVGQTQRLFQFHVERIGRAYEFQVAPELLAQGLYLDDGLFERLLGAGHAHVLPHDVAQTLVYVVHRLLAAGVSVLTFGA